MAGFALSLVIATSLGLLIVGRRFLHSYLAREGTQPPATWLFQRAKYPELETLRRTGLVLLPLYLIAAIVYLARP